MQANVPSRAFKGLQVFLSSPICIASERRVCRRALQLPPTRHISSSFKSRQQTTPASNTSPSQVRPLPSQSQSPVNAERVQHDLSPSSESDPLRSLTDGLSDPPPILSEEEKQVDWTRSYHGLSSSPFTSEQCAILQQELDFDDVEVKPDGIVYLPEIKYRRILNRAFGPGGWGLAPRGETIVTGKLVTREYGLVCGGRYGTDKPSHHKRDGFVAD
jgi:hypothetical protein